MDELIETLRIGADVFGCGYRDKPLERLLRQAAAALEAAREDACVSLVADIRFACGDNGKRMQPELVEFIRGLAADAARYRHLFDCPEPFCYRGDVYDGKQEADEAIDQARGKGGCGEGVA